MVEIDDQYFGYVCNCLYILNPVNLSNVDRDVANFYEAVPTCFNASILILFVCNIAGHCAAGKNKQPGRNDYRSGRQPCPYPVRH